MIEEKQQVFLSFRRGISVLYHFELQLAGVILLSAMAAGALSLWLKRRKEQKALDQSSKENEDTVNRKSSDN